MEGFLGSFPELSYENGKEPSPLALAYIGDAVYEVFVRKQLMGNPDLSVHKLHKEATRYVKANSQARIVLALEKDLTNEEWGIVKKGRNQKSKTMPKNSTVSDYRYATGFEALLGHLFISERTERLMEIMNKAVEIIIEEECQNEE